MPYKRYLYQQLARVIDMNSDYIPNRSRRGVYWGTDGVNLVLPARLNSSPFDLNNRQAVLNPQYS